MPSLSFPPSDFEELDSEVRSSTSSPSILTTLAEVPKRETVLTLFGGNHSSNIVKRCRKLCKYLRVLLGGDLRELPYLQNFLKLQNLTGNGHLSNFQGHFGSIFKEGSIEVCGGCSSLRDVTYFKRRYAVLSQGAGLFMYRHHDDLGASYVNSLDVNIVPGGVLHAERLAGGGVWRRGKKKSDYTYWRIWVEEGVGKSYVEGVPEIYDHRTGEQHEYWRVGSRGSRYVPEYGVGGRRGHSSRWNVVCRGTERMCRDWMSAVLKMGVVVNEEDEEEMDAGSGLTKGGEDTYGDVTESSSGSSTGSRSSSMVDSSSEDEGRLGRSIRRR